MQFNLLKSENVDAQSNCFYAAYAIAESMSTLGYDLTHFYDSETGTANWFNILAYDPMHITGNSSVVYE